jgi:predicted flap endonuclease-1-like 5' DNA nuclease
MSIAVGFLLFGVGVLVGALAVLLLAEPVRVAGRRPTAEGMQTPVIANRPSARRRAAQAAPQPALDAAPPPIVAPFDPLVTENESLRERLDALTQELETAEAEAQTLQDNLYRVGMRLETLEGENETLRQELAAVQNRPIDETAVEMAPESAVVSEQVEDLQAQIKGLLRQLTETQSLRTQLVTARAELDAARAEIEHLQSQVTTQSEAKKTLLQSKVGLEAIQGIGSTYARRLREAGVRTLNDLAGQTPERLAEIVGLKAWQGGDPARWIAEARALVAEPATPAAPPATDPPSPAIRPSQSDQ